MQDLYYRRIINSDILGIEDLPDNLKNRDVEVIIIPAEEKIETIDFDSINGVWKDFDISLKNIRDQLWK